MPFLVPIERLFGQTAGSKQVAPGCSIIGKVKEITVEQLQVDEKEVQLKSRFKEDLGADSLDLVELVMQFEEAFQIEIPDDDALKLATVESAVNYIDAHVSKAKLAQLCPSKPSPIKSKAPF
jgi:acyl carrier protein